MTDEQLAKFLSVPVGVIRVLPPEKRRAYERLSQASVELDLWQAGLSPKPAGVLVDFDKKRKRP